MSMEQAIQAAEFHRGPHDGLVLKMEEIYSWCRLVRAKKGTELRLFAMIADFRDGVTCLIGTQIDTMMFVYFLLVKCAC